MSRYQEGDEPDYANAYELWQANLQRALAGKRGQQALRDLKEGMLALPQKRLIARAMCTVGGEARLEKEVSATYSNWVGRAENDRWMAMEREERAVIFKEEGVCAVGAYIWWLKVKGGQTQEEAFAALPTLDDMDHDIEESVGEGRKAGLVGCLAFELAFRNDELYEMMNSGERWVAFMDWIEERLAA